MGLLALERPLIVDNERVLSALAMNPVRVGVIGIGNMGWHHARV